MKILHILKSEPDESISRIIHEHESAHEVIVLNLCNKENIDYDFIIDLFENCDKIIAW